MIKTRIAVFAAALLIGSPQAFAQFIGDPSGFARNNPNLDVLNGGAPTPATRLESDPAAMQAYAARESGTGGESARHRSHDRAMQAYAAMGGGVGRLNVRHRSYYPKSDASPRR